MNRWTDGRTNERKRKDAGWWVAAAADANAGAAAFSRLIWQHQLTISSSPLPRCYIAKHVVWSLSLNYLVDVRKTRTVVDDCISGS